MAKTVNLPNDQTAIIKDDSELTNREIKELRRAARTAGAVALKLKEAGFNQEDPDTWIVATQLSDEDDAIMDIYQRTCVALRIVSWTLTDIEVPKTADAVDDLPRSLSVPLIAACSKVNFSDDFEVNPDPKADTAS